MTEKTVRLIENFNSYQGEGPDSGRAMIILRFKTCNLNCPWCDTSVKMRISAEAPHKLSDIQKQINETRSGIMITGGEPTVKRHIDEAVYLLNLLDYPIANVESNGYNLEELIKRSARSKNIHFIYSPKMFSHEDVDIAAEKTINFFDYDNVFIKIVYEDNSFIRDYCEWLSAKIYGRKRFHDKVWLMPEGTTRADLIRNSEKVFDACERYRFNFSSRSHIIFGFI
ncbi:MAG: radical SAM protein [Candidatus Thorarchaeota archaeon]